MNFRQINESIDEANTLRDLTQAFVDISSEKIKRIRTEVERNRIFFDDLFDMYVVLKKIARANNILAAKKNGRTVSILLTSNEKFYGNINEPLMRFFFSHVQAQTDIVIIGQTGYEYFNEHKNLSAKIKAVHLAHDIPSETELKTLTDFADQYEEILVFFTEFKSMISQVPTLRDIGGRTDQFLQQNFQKEATQNLHYILEPELRKMVTFFDTQIKTLLLEQTFFESELSRTASRLMAMDEATGHANELVRDRIQDLGRAKRSMFNTRLLETIGALNSWKGKQIE